MLLVISVLIIIVFFYFSEVKTFRLVVINNSLERIDQVRLFGSAVAKQRHIEAMLPGVRSELVVTLHSQGGLQFEVSQGLNRIDSYIEADVTNIKQFKQLLRVESDYRYIISDSLQ